MYLAQQIRDWDCLPYSPANRPPHAVPGPPSPLILTVRARRARWPLLRTAIVRARRRSRLLTALDRCSAVAPDPRRARSPRTLAPAPDGHRPHAPTFTATEGTRPLLRRSPCPTAIPRAAAPMATSLDGPRSRRPQLRRPSIPTAAVWKVSHTPEFCFYVSFAGADHRLNLQQACTFASALPGRVL